MKRSHLVYAAVNVVQLAAVLTAWSVHQDATHAQAASAWSWPLAGTAVVDRPFEPPASTWGAGHRGVDLRGTEGTPVLAAGAGTVTYSGLLAGKGVVVVQHAGGLRTTYEPLVTDGPPVGAHVAVNDPIGHLTGGHASCRAGTTCLHWGLLRGTTYLDPLSLVLQGRLRLLPLTPRDAASIATAPTSAGRHTSVTAVEGLSAATSQEPGSPAAAASSGPSAARRFGLATLNLAALAAFGYSLLAGARRTGRFVRNRWVRARA